MAFDFVSYIGQQVEQAYPNIFAEETKSQRSFFILHLVSIQLLQLIREKTKQGHEIYKNIQENQSNWLSNSSLKNIENDSTIQEHFIAISATLNTTVEKIAAIIIDELHQLDHNANLGESGIYELLKGQMPWIHQHCGTWILSAEDEQPAIVSVNEAPAVNFNEVIHDFNQTIRASNQEEHLSNSESELKAIVQNQTHTPQNFYYFLNPILAAIIILVLFIILYNL